jgi:hypothetical protein
MIYDGPLYRGKHRSTLLQLRQRYLISTVATNGKDTPLTGGDAAMSVPPETSLKCPCKRSPRTEYIPRQKGGVPTKKSLSPGRSAGYPTFCYHTVIRFSFLLDREHCVYCLPVILPSDRLSQPYWGQHLFCHRCLCLSEALATRGSSSPLCRHNHNNSPISGSKLVHTLHSHPPQLDLHTPQ